MSTVAERYDRVFAVRPDLRAVVAAVLRERRDPVEPSAPAPVAAPPAVRAAPPSDYRELVARVTGVVSALVERDASVLVVSRGDPDLLALASGRAAHFPQSADGGFAGFYPRDGESAVAHLRELREGGAAYLVFPATSAWWLDHYAPLASHLLTTARAVHHDADCLVFDLQPERSHTHREVA